MYKIKALTKTNGPIYLDATDHIQFTNDGRVFAYLAGRSSAVELDPALITPERYERILFRANRFGYVALTDMTKLGHLLFINDPSDPQIDLDPTPQPKTAETLDYDLVQVAMDALK